jgi:hypothetical protein
VPQFWSLSSPKVKLLLQHVVVFVVHLCPLVFVPPHPPVETIPKQFVPLQGTVVFFGPGQTVMLGLASCAAQAAEAARIIIDVITAFFILAPFQ